MDGGRSCLGGVDGILGEVGAAVVPVRGCLGRPWFSPKISNQIFNPMALYVAVQSSHLHSKCRTLLISQNRSLFWSRSQGSNPEQHLGFSEGLGIQVCPPEPKVSKSMDLNSYFMCLILKPGSSPFGVSHYICQCLDVFESFVAPNQLEIFYIHT